MLGLREFGDLTGDYSACLRRRSCQEKYPNPGKQTERMQPARHRIVVFDQASDLVSGLGRKFQKGRFAFSRSAETSANTGPNGGTLWVAESVFGERAEALRP